MVATQPPRSPETAPEILPDRWIVAPWADYQQAIEQTTEKVKGYYYDGTMRLEMSPVGNPHSRDHSIVNYAVLLFAALRGLRVNAHDNCTYRKTGAREAQPDLSVYVGDRVKSLDWETKIVDLDRFPPPDLAIEISDSTLLDDYGRKRLLYEDLGVAEYWVVDVAEAIITGFEMIDRGSRRIQESLVLPGLKLDVLEAALRRSRETDHGQACAWLLEQWRA